MSRFPLLLVVCSFSAASFAATTPFFDQGIRAAIQPSRPEALAADLNGDGKTDLIIPVGSGGEAAIGIFTARGDGSFDAKPVLPIGDERLRAIGDINGDGKADLLAGGNPVYVMIGNGDGTFAQGATLDTGSAGIDFVGLADVTADAVLDIVVHDGNSGFLSTFRGKGNGEFEAPVPSSLGTETSFTLADANGDGRADLFYLDGSAIRYVLANGAGDWSMPKLATEKGAVVFTVARVDGDSIPDIMTPGIFMHGEADGTFTPVDPSTDVYNAYPFRPSITAIDLTGDGKLDFVVRLQGEHIAVLRGHGDGTFDTPLFYQVPFTATPVSGSFDGDAVLDLAAVASDAPVQILHGNGDGTFRGDRGYALTNVSNASWYDGPRIAVADVTADGKLDVVTLAKRPGALDFSTITGNGDGTFSRGSRSSLPFTDEGGLALADFNGDGTKDAVVSNTSDVRFDLYSGSTDRSFNFAASTGSSGARQYGIVVADFNRDGHLDILGTTGPAVFLGDGALHFGARIGVVGPHYAPFAVADINGDGILDAAGGYFGGTDVLIGKGDGSFEKRATLTDFMVGLGDFDSDGRADLATTDGSGAYVIRHGNGDGSFAAPGKAQTAVFPFFIEAEQQPDFEAVDVDGDGDLDVASAVAVLFGNGAGAFDGYALVPLPNVEGAVYADVDGNGTRDWLQPSSDLAFVDVKLTRRQTSRDLPVSLTLGITDNKLTTTLTHDPHFVVTGTVSCIADGWMYHFGSSCPEEIPSAAQRLSATFSGDSIFGPATSNDVRVGGAPGKTRRRAVGAR